MSRIRTVKPEFWISDQIAECSRNARLLFIGLWSFCDDSGRHPASARRLKAEVFPGDDLTTAEVETWISELVAAGLILPYVVDGKGFWLVTGWHHQRIDKPQPARYPSPDSEGAIHGAIPEDSTNVRPPKGREGKGKERKGKEGSLEDSSEPAAPASEPSAAVIVFPVVGDRKKKTWDLTPELLREFEAAFPALDVLSEFGRARLWLGNNPTKKKTAGGMRRFLGAWLGTSQNRGGGTRPLPPEDTGGVSKGLNLGGEK